MKDGKPNTQRIGWIFALGHGHYTQFLNFRDYLDGDGSAMMLGLTGELPPSTFPLARLLPHPVRHRLGEIQQVAVGLASHARCDTLFIACENTGLMRFVRRFPSFLYTDLSPSLKRELSPWYVHQFSRIAPLQAMREHAHARVARACRGVFTMSTWAARGISHDYRVPPERVHVVLPGANLRRWHRVDRRGRPAHRPIRVLMVGGQFRRKGGELLLDWAERTRARNWEMDIVTWPGELPEWIRTALGNPGADEPAAAALGPRLPHVRIHCGVRANTPELTHLFEEADVFCLPTQADGSSIASLEAMATGLPVLVSAVGGIPDLVEDGKTGLLLRRGDAGDLAAKIEALISDAALRESLGSAARNACEAHLNVERQLREIRACIARCAPRSSDLLDSQET